MGRNIAEATVSSVYGIRKHQLIYPVIGDVNFDYFIKVGSAR